MRLYEELADFIARGPISREVAEFRASVAASERPEELIRREKTDGLSEEEIAELERAMHLEHFMGLAKARARVHLAGE
jgi:hypothetical protein